MAKTLYVGNLSFDATEEEVREFFEQHGTVLAVRLVTDRDTGRPRGFGFVEMDDEDADKAAEATNGVEFGGRTLRVDEAREKGPRPPRRDGPSW